MLLLLLLLHDTIVVTAEAATAEAATIAAAAAAVKPATSHARCGSRHNRDRVDVKCSAMSGAVKCQGPCQETVLTTVMDP